MQTKYKFVLFLLLVGLVLIAGHVYEAVRIQNQIDNYLDKNSEVIEKHPCNLKDTGNQIILKCSSKESKYNETHDKISWRYESSGGTISSGEYFVPHFEPINKSENLKLVKEDSRYLVTWNYPIHSLDGIISLDYYSLKEIISYIVPLLTAILFVIIIYFSYHKKLNSKKK
ncbi:MAG: hypothetical protein DRP06_01085 [Candidatus Aenigmatarchaeota archaeon]|nr:MAG: hypothetical protein DRP06_01085 [Candidatus Aenigmarchaeota archaeon]